MRPVCVSIQPAPGADGVVVHTPAKINLWLRVLGRRPDGYHELDTLMVAVSLRDTLTLVRGGGGLALVTTGETVPSGSDNLCTRAARTFQGAAGLTGGLQLRLHKRIPVGGGLGGGSGNAAGVLLGLQELHGHPLTGAQVQELAAELGSDVPFFLHGQTAHCRGRGEQVTQLESAPRLEVVLVTPDITVSTSAVYGELRNSDLPHVNQGILHARAKKTGVWVGRDSPRTEPGRGEPTAPRASGARACPPGGADARGASCWVHGRSPAEIAALAHNDLEAAALRVHPELHEVREALRSAELGVVTLCGSGSSFFVLPAPEHRPEVVRDRISALGLGRVHLVSTHEGTETALDPE